MEPIKIPNPRMTEEEIASEYPKACSAVDALKKALLDAETLDATNLLGGLREQLQVAIHRKVDIFYENLQWRRIATEGTK